MVHYPLQGRSIRCIRRSHYRLGHRGLSHRGCIHRGCSHGCNPQWLIGVGGRGEENVPRFVLAAGNRRRDKVIARKGARGARAGQRVFGAQGPPRSIT